MDKISQIRFKKIPEYIIYNFYKFQLNDEKKIHYEKKEMAVITLDLLKCKTNRIKLDEGD